MAATVYASTFWGLPSPVIRAAGPAGQLIETIEIATRASWGHLREVLDGNPNRELPLVQDRRFRRLLEGESSQLGSALRLQPLPWDLSDDPLARVIERCRILIERVDEMRALEARRSKVEDERRTLEDKFGSRLPCLWQRSVIGRGISRQRIEQVETLEELEHLGAQIQRISAILHQRSAELDAWLVAGGFESMSRSAEDQFELLLQLERVDRETVYRQSAMIFRRAVQVHLRIANRDTVVGREPLELQLARQYGLRTGLVGITSEETAVTRACLIAAAQRANLT